jgi:hypothetical protein
VAADQFVGQLVSRLMARSDAWGQQAPPPPPPQEEPQAAVPAAAARASGREASQPAAVGSSGGSGMTALEEEMLQLQLQLRGQAEDIQQLGLQAAAAAGQAFEAQCQQQQEEYHERQRQKRQQWQQQQQYGGGGEGGGEDEGWQDVRGSSGARHARGAGAQAGPPPSGGDSSGGQAIPPNTGLWLGWIDMHVEAAQLAQALTRCAPACAREAWACYAAGLAALPAACRPCLLAGWLAGCLPDQPACSPASAGRIDRAPS